MIPPSHRHSPAQRFTSGDKRPSADPTEETDDGHKRQRTEEHGDTKGQLPSEVIGHLASSLLVPLEDPKTPLPTETMRVHLLAIATLSRLNTHWRDSLSGTMDTHCARYARPFVALYHEPRSCSIYSDEEDLPAPAMPLAFDGLDVQNIAFVAKGLLKAMLSRDQSPFVGALLVRALLKAAAELARTDGVPPEDRLGMQRLPLTVLALAFQRGLFADPPHFTQLVALLIGHWNRYPTTVQVLLKEDLDSLYQDNPDRLEAINQAWMETTTPEAHEAAKVRRARLDALNARSKRDERGARLYALKEMTSPPWYPSSPSRILALSWIARHWNTLPCLDNRVRARQDELETHVLELFDEVAADIGGHTEHATTGHLLQAFPAPLRQTVLDKMKDEQRHKLLRGVDI